MDQNRKIMWIYHPNQNVRMLRAKQPNEGIDINIDLSPNYSDDIKICILISSFGEIDDIKNRINELKKYNILIYDDHSENVSKIREFKSENIEFYSPDKSKWHDDKFQYFDESALYYGLNWAKQNNFDILIKMNSVSKINENDINNLIKLAKESDGITFSRSDKNCLFMTDTFALNVNAWTNSYVDRLMNWYIENDIPVINELWYHELAKELDYQVFSKKYSNYKMNNFKGYLRSGYVDWKIDE